MKRKAGCIACHQANLKIGYLEFTNIFGKYYQAYFCQACFENFNNKIDVLTNAEKINEYQKLEAIINKKLFY